MSNRRYTRLACEHIAAHERGRQTSATFARACAWIERRGVWFYYEGAPKDGESFTDAVLTHARSCGWPG